MSEVFLVRHGETEWNVAGRFQGRQDSSLTAVGREQAAQLGCILRGALPEHLAPRWHVSPLGRAQDTAAIMAQFLPTAEMILEPRLQEVSIGTWEGLTLEDIAGEWPNLLEGTDHFDWYFRSPDGETLDAALTRVRSWLEELQGPVIAISHGLLGRLVRGSWLGLSPEEMLRLPVPQDVVWHLAAEGVRPLRLQKTKVS